MPTPLSSRTVFEGRVFRVQVDRVRLPHGTEATLEIVRHRGSVVLLPMPDPGHVILVRQYRYAVDEWVWELPAGSLEDGEVPEDAARRECHEEVGLMPGKAEHLGTLFPTPGYCDEAMMFYRLTDLQEPQAPAAHDEDEALEPRRFSLDELRAEIAAGRILDMKTVAGMMLLTIHKADWGLRIED